MSAVSTQSNGTIMLSCVQLTSLYRRNCAQKSSAQLHIPSNIMGCLPRSPPFKGTCGVTMVTFADIVGGSNGNDPYRDTTGSRVAASASSAGFGAAINSLLACSFSGPQVVWFCSDPNSDITGDRAQCSIRLVICIWTVGVV